MLSSFACFWEVNMYQRASRIEYCERKLRCGKKKLERLQACSYSKNKWISKFHRLRLNRRSICFALTLTLSSTVLIFAINIPDISLRNQYIKKHGSDISVSSYVTILFEENSECAASKYTKFSLTEGCWRKCVIALWLWVKI